jgi:hypothetical protein
MCLYLAAFLFSSEIQGLLGSLPFLDFVAQKEMLLLSLNEKRERGWKLLQEGGVAGDFVVSHHLASLSGTRLSLLL